MRRPSISFMLLLTSAFLACPLASAQANPMKEWTLLIYLNGHNSLDKFGYSDINEMEKVGSTDQTDVVVQWASLSAPDTTKRMHIEKDNDIYNVTSPVVQGLRTVDMGDYHSLIEFVRWGIQKYPAKHYFVVVWNHGGGWHIEKKSDVGGNLTPQDISWDDLTGHFISTEQLGVAMQEIRQIRGAKIELLGFDACLMSMGEVLVEVEGSVDYVVGSQELEPGKGWPYDALLSEMKKVASPTASDISKILTLEYVKSYSNGSQGSAEVTLSAFDLKYLKEFKDAVVLLGQAVRSIPEKLRPTLQAVLRNTQTFDFQDYMDVGDLVSGLKKANLINSFQPAANSMSTALDRLVIANQTTNLYKRATGLSFWLPQKKKYLVPLEARYQNLKFNRDTDWLQAIRYVAQ